MISVICPTIREGAKEFLEKQLAKQTFKDFETIIIGRETEIGEGNVWTLNRDYNKALSKAKGELIVFLQDFIEIPANGLQRFWDLYQLYPNDLITGCGHKYKDGRIVETDDRCFGDRKLVPSDWTYYELNWASCPTKVAPKFEESMDKYYGGENQIFALKSTLINKNQVWLDRANECKGLAHEDRPKDWEESHINKSNRHNEIIKWIYTQYNPQ